MLPATQFGERLPIDSDLTVTSDNFADPSEAYWRLNIGWEGRHQRMVITAGQDPDQRVRAESGGGVLQRCIHR